MHEKSAPKPSDIPSMAIEPKQFRIQTKIQAEKALLVQAKIFDNFEILAKSWIQRRRAASQQALSTVARMCDCDNPADASAVYNEWLSNSIDRLIADSRAINEQSMQVFQQMLEQVVAEDGGTRAKPAEIGRKESTKESTEGDIAERPARSAHR